VRGSVANGCLIYPDGKPSIFPIPCLLSIHEAFLTEMGGILSSCKFSIDTNGGFPHHKAC